MLLMAVLWLCAHPVFATRWTLVNFGTNEASTVMPYPGWNQLLRHPAYTEFVDPDGNPDHAGITESGGIPEGDYAYYGVQGTNAINMQPGHTLVVTFYNRSDEYIYLPARLSVCDTNSPDPADGANPWHTISSTEYTLDGDWIPPYSLVEMEYYISNSNMVCAIDGPSSAGSNRVVNISKPDNDNRFVLTRIELTDEGDRVPPNAPTNLQVACIALTDEATNAVQLSWNAATDPGPYASGISRYLIYRNGALYDLVDPVVTEWLGNDLYYIDPNVAPDTPYSYTVTALDKAPFGLYPKANRPDSRVGNESAHAGPVTITTPFWNSITLVNPWTDLHYAGGIRLPYLASEPWAYASGGLTWYPSGNAGHNPATEWPGSLFGLTHINRGIAELNIPIPVLSTNIDDLPRAAWLHAEATNLWPVIYDGSSTPAGGTEHKVASIAYHPAAAGVGERLYYGLCNYYNTDPDAPSHGWIDTALATGFGAWHIGGMPPTNVYPGLTAAFLFAVPTNWAAAHLDGRSLWVGNTMLSGGAQICNGPSLYAVAPWSTGSLPTNGGSTAATMLLRYSPIGTVSNRVLNWHIDRFAQGGAWLETGGRHAIAISFRRPVGDFWYGDSRGNNNVYYDIPEPPFGDKGGSATAWRNTLMFYNPADLVDVAQGHRESWEPQPYALCDLQAFSMLTNVIEAEAGAICVSTSNNALFYIEQNGDPAYPDGYGLIHAWTLESGYQPTLQIHPESTNLAITWQTANDGRDYQLSASPSLDQPPWTNIGPAIIGDGSSQTARVSGAAGACFRLVTPD
jgi:hypothetical protein